MHNTNPDSIILHLVEIRNRLIRTTVVVLAIFMLLIPWAGDIYDIFALPMMSSIPQGASMIATNVVTPFLIPIKLTLLVSFLLALPYVLYQIWGFISPGLYHHEQRLLIPIVLFSLFLFLLGVLFCYFVVFKTVFHFIIEFAPDSIAIAPDIEEYLGFIMTMFISFGIAFETPILVLLLVYSGSVSIQTLRQSRPYVIVGAFVLGAIVAPPDILSQFLLAIPLCLLYELGLIIVRWLPSLPGQHDQEGDHHNQNPDELS